jgi:hypothetical protein
MTAAGAAFSAAAAARVLGPGWGESFASWDPSTTSWREDELDSQAPAAADLGPEFTVGWPSIGLTRRCSALALEDSGRETSGRGALRPAAPAISSASIPRRSWGTPRAASGMTSRLRDPANIHAADGRLEDQVALAEGRPGGWLNPEWVEWLMGFPAGWSRSTPAAEPEGEIGRRGREAAPGAAPAATRVAAATLPPSAGFAHHGDDPRGPEKLRSPRHPETRS